MPKNISFVEYVCISREDGVWTNERCRLDTDLTITMNCIC